MKLCSTNLFFLFGRCLRGDNDSCRCEDPLQPQSRGEFRSWSKAHGSNKEVVHALVEKAQNPDIAFVGSSVVEEMDGRWFGDARDDQLASLEKIFKKNFNRQEGGTLEGVALGIAGDTVSICKFNRRPFSSRSQFLTLCAIRVLLFCGD
jgi:hypothetical protein